jgi:uncharacterized protein YybS (DUF2232 family)
MLAARLALFVQGLSIFAWLYRKAGLSSPLRGLSYVLLAVVETALPVAGLAGLADLWINLRRLPRKGDTRTPDPIRSGSTD